MVKICYNLKESRERIRSGSPQLKLWFTWQIQKLTLELRCHVQYYVWTMYITFSVFILNCIEYLKDFLIFKKKYLSVNAKKVPNIKF